MSKQAEFDDFLSESGQEVFSELKKHCQAKLKMMDADDFELAMLANSFDLYRKNAQVCNTDGVTLIMITKTGEYQMVRPEYTVMKQEYQNILKHSGKFGLNPGDRAKFFKGLGKEARGAGFNLNMKKAG